jgi:DNA-binding MarR family transcriptional regulator
VTLTREGRKVYMHHMRFHTLMVRELESGFSEEEKDVLVGAIGKLDRFFQKSIEVAT